MSETLAKYLVLLDAKRQEYIVHCINTYGRRDEDIHRGLLPFIPCIEASVCLKWKLEMLRTVVITKDEIVQPQKGLKFVTSIIDIISPGVSKPTNVNGKSSVFMYLNTKALIKAYGNSLHKKQSIKMNQFDVLLEAVTQGKWKVTCDEKALHQVTMELAKFNANGVKP